MIDAVNLSGFHWKSSMLNTVNRLYMPSILPRLNSPTPGE